LKSDESRPRVPGGYEDMTGLKRIHGEVVGHFKAPEKAYITDTRRVSHAHGLRDC